MKVLALELSTAVGSIAWSDADAEPFAIEFANDRKHSGAFFENIERVINRFGVPELIAVGLGPGSYAGTRIAIAAATGIAASTGAQLSGICSLRAFLTDAETYTVIGDARRQSFFFARITKRECSEGPVLCTRDELIARVAATAHPVFASEKIADVPEAVLAYPSARILAQFAARNPEPHLAAALEPIYLREPHITQPKPVVMPKAVR